MTEAEDLLSQNGGRITTRIKDPKLTHIIMDDDDSIRYAELVRKTAKSVFPFLSHRRCVDWDDRPKHKHIVLPSWVKECVEEETLMNEDGELFLMGWS